MDDELRLVDQYYSEKINQYGRSAKGVDWKDENSMELRFDQLAHLFLENEFTVNDLGCGYGALYEYLNRKYKIHYYGYDLSEAMINVATYHYRNESNAQFIQEKCVTKPMDYTVASGIFNVRLIIEDKIWNNYLVKMLHNMHQMSVKGFAFNLLTSYSDPPCQKEKLYYANPLDLFHYCKTHFSKKVTLLHDYDLYEFTLIVRK